MRYCGKSRGRSKQTSPIHTVIAGAFLAALIGVGFTPSPAAALPELKVQGDRIVEANTGKPVRLRGVKILSNTSFHGLGDRQPKADRWVFDRFMPLTQDHYDQIKSWGANTVAYEIWWTGTLGPTERDPRKPGVYDYKGLEILRQHIRAANDAGLYAMVLVRVCWDKNYAKPGNFTGWATHDYVLFNQRDVAGKGGLDRFQAYLQWLTKNIADEPNLAAISPWYFPYHRQLDDFRRNPVREQRYYDIVVPGLVRAIRTYTNKMIVVSFPLLGHYYDANRVKVHNDRNIIYGTGGYGDLKTVTFPDAPKWDYNVSKIKFPDPSWKQFEARYYVPIMNMEGPGISQHSWPKKNGVPQIPRDRLDLFAATLDIVNEMDGWLIHEYGHPEVFSVLLGKNPNSPASEGAMVERIQDALLD